MSILIDLILVAIIALVVAISAKKGFVCTVVGVVGFIAAAVIAFTVSKPLADITYDKLIEPNIINSAGKSISDTTNLTADEVWNALPKILTDNAEKLNITKESLNTVLSKNTTSKNALENISKTAIKPVVTEIIKTLFSVILLTVLLFIVKILANLINKAFSFSIVGKLNTVLGGILGIPKGILIVFVLCKVIMLLISFTDNGIWIFNNQNIENTILFKFLTNIF